jgi:ribosomal-protein-alanine N-acetyltransferase
MDVHESIVALQGFAEEIAMQAAGDGISICRAAPDDMVDLERLDAACFDEFWRYGSTELADSFRRERMMVASVEGEILGYATCSLHGASGTVGRLAVSPSARRRGLGRALLVDAAAWAAGSNAYALTLCTQRDNTVSRRLYTASGLFELPDRYVIGVCGT